MRNKDYLLNFYGEEIDYAGKQIKTIKHIQTRFIPKRQDESIQTTC